MIGPDLPDISVKLRDFARADEVWAACGVHPDDEPVPELRLALVRADDGVDPAVALSALRGHPLVERARYDVPLVARGNPLRAYRAPVGDPALSAVAGPADHLVRHGALRAWKFVTGSPSITISVHDTGTKHHPDFPEPALGTNLWNLAGNNPDDVTALYVGASETSFYSHGSICSGLIFGTKGNGLSSAGAASGCRRMMMAHSNVALNWPSAYQMAQAWVWQVNNGARVISCSWGYWVEPASAEYHDLKDGSDWVWANNAVIVAACNNDGMEERSTASPGGPNQGPAGEVDIPQALPNVVVVGAVGRDENRAIWYSHDSISQAPPPGTEGGIDPNGSSGWGARVDITALGLVYASTFNLSNPGTPAGVGIPEDHWEQGCSFSAPQVSAALGLILSANPALTNAQAVDILLTTQDAPRGTTFRTWFPRAGVLNHGKAVLKALSTVPANAGQVWPDAQVWGPGVTHAYGATQVTTKIAGTAYLDLTGYSSDPIDSVDLYVNGARVYTGPPARLTLTGTYDGSTAVPLQIVARTAGASTSETISPDIAATTLAVVSAVPFGADITPPTASVALVAHAPTVAVTAASVVSVTTPTANLALTAHAPVVSLTAPILSGLVGVTDSLPFWVRGPGGIPTQARFTLH